MHYATDNAFNQTYIGGHIIHSYALVVATKLNNELPLKNYNF
jgi:hypothetical protein